MTDKKYYDVEGNEVSLLRLIRIDPGWAISRIREGEKAEHERDALRKAIEDALKRHYGCNAADESFAILEQALKPEEG